MKTSFKTMVLVVGLTLITPTTSILASELTQEFKNPAFSGNGYSTHVLSINQLEVQRKQKVIDDEKSAASPLKEMKRTRQ